MNIPMANKLISNVSQVLTLWNGIGVDWKTFGGNADYPVTDFVRYIEFMGATGGSGDRDHFVNPSDKMVKDDYDFSRLLSMCRGTLDAGLKPYLKLGNVPGKFTADYDPGSFGMNIRPPSDHLDHYRYMRACAAALKDEFGVDEVRSWRFSVLTECDNQSWFRSGNGGREETKREFFKLYDFTVEAFEEELGKGIAIGTHLLNPVHGDTGNSSFSWRDVIAHCAFGDNAATGGKGAPLRLLAISYYIGKPGAIHKCIERLDILSDMRRELDANGFGDAILGVDEGRVLSSEAGSDKADLPMRIVGDSYEAAFDVRLAKTIIDSGADYFAAWGYFSNGATLGVPSHSYFTACEIAKFEGMRRFDLEPVDGLDIIAAISQDGSTIRVMAGLLHDDLLWSGETCANIRIVLPAGFRGDGIIISTLTLDDSNNWFTQWRKDRVEIGVGPMDYRWSWDDPCIFGAKSLQNEPAKRIFEERLLPKYSAIAAGVKPVAARLLVPDNGVVCLPLRFNGNGACFMQLGKQASTLR